MLHIANLPSSLRRVARRVRVAAPAVALAALLSLSPAHAQFQTGVTYPAGGENSITVVAADFDGDGDVDLAVANFGSSSVGLLRNNGNGTFATPVAFPVQSLRALAVADFTSDGSLDILTGRVLLTNNGSGLFTASEVFQGLADAISTGDFNRDGKVDVIINIAGEEQFSLRLGNGDGTFGDPNTFPFREGYFAGDLNGDGFEDLLVYSATGAAAILLNENDPPEPLDVGAGFSAAGFGDLDRDGDIDIVAFGGAFTGTTSQVRAVLNDGTGRFGTPLEAATIDAQGGAGVVIADLNGDGIPDLALGGGNRSAVFVLTGTGTGTFNAAVSYKAAPDPDPHDPDARAVVPRAIEAADFNNDGRVDLATGNGPSDNVSVLLAGENAQPDLPPFTSFTVQPGPENRSGVPWTFTASHPTEDITVQVQSTLTPADEASWTPLTGLTRQSGEIGTTYTLTTSNIPTGNRFFRAIATKTGFTRAVSNVAGPFDVTGVPIEVVRAKAAPSSPSTPLVRVTDPVNSIFGNFYYQHADLSLGGALSIGQLVRSYNSVEPADGILGFGWNLSYDLRVQPVGSELIEVKRGDGRVDRYTRSGGSLIPPPGSADALAEVNGGYTLTTGTRMVYRFNTAGRLQSATSPDGNRTTLTYSGELWTGLTEPSGRSWTLSYDKNNRINAITDPSGRKVLYGYSKSGDLVTVTVPLTKGKKRITRYEYDTSHRLTRITDARKKLLLENTYDAAGRVTAQTDPRGTSRLNYGANRTVFTDATGATTTLDYDAAFQPTKITDALGNSRTFTYTAEGRPAAETNAGGGVTTYTYDDRGNVTSVTNPMGGVTEATYDQNNNVVTRTDPLDRTTTFGYDAQGRLIEVTDPLGNKTRFTYSSQGLITSTTAALGGVTRYEYDAAGNRTLVTDPLGASTSFEYDAAGRVIASTDPLGAVTRYQYDPQNNVIGRIAADGGKSKSKYDAVGNRTVEIDPLKRTTVFKYDDANRMIEIKDPLRRKFKSQFDAAGRVVGTTLPEGQSSSTSFDALGRTTAQTSPLGNTTGYAYDANGNLTRLTDPAGNVIEYAYDLNGRLTTVTDPLGGTTRLTYDAVGNRTSKIDALGHTTTYEYDALNRLTRETNALGHTRTSEYDALGRVVKETRGTGEVITYTYDAAGRLIQETSPTGTVAFSYDAAGNRTSMTDATGTTQYSHDKMGRITSVQGWQGTVTYSYDRGGNRTGLEQPEQKLSYVYDKAGRLSALREGKKALVAYTWDKSDNNISQRFGNGVTTSLSYDADRRLTGIRTAKGKDVLQQITYTLNAVGARSAEQATGFSATYQYDQLYRLTVAGLTVNGAPKSFAYTYDAAGNRLSETRDGVVTAYTYDDANRIVSAGAATFTHDDEGRLTSDGVNTYSYNVHGQLLAITGAVNASYAYDGDRNNVGESIDGQTKSFRLDVANFLPLRIAEIGASDRLFVHGVGLVAESGSEGVLFQHQDGLGSIRLETSADAEVAGQFDYEPFGLPLGTAPEFGFAGDAYTAGDSLLYLRARFYSPVLGRFLTTDPQDLPPVTTQTANLYNYALNSPVNLRDPGGENALQGLWNGAVGVLKAGAGLVAGGVQTAATFTNEVVLKPVVNTVRRVFTPPPPVQAQQATIFIPRAPRPIPTTESSRTFGGTVDLQNAQGEIVASITEVSAGVYDVAGRGGIIALGGANAAQVRTFVANIVALGGGNIVAVGGGNLVGLNGSNLISKTLTNIIALGGANIVALGGGNIVALGGGNVIANGGNNVIANGGNNVISGNGSTAVPQNLGPSFYRISNADGGNPKMGLSPNAPGN